MMFKREITEKIITTVNTFPVTVLVGPRQSGKTTLLKQLFPDFFYFNLEVPENRLQAKQDPKATLQLNAGNMIIDEAQYVPELFSYIQDMVDNAPVKKKFILSGSQNILLSEKVSQSLSGRAAILELLPLNFQELLSDTEISKKTPPLWQLLFQGFYPRPYNEQLDFATWYSSYIRTYLERDVRQLINITDLGQFQLFLKLCAGLHGQLLNLNNLAQAVSISQTTAARWLSLLETSYILFKLPPYHVNFKKRLVKTPKIYFYDSALVCSLLGIESPEHLQMHAARGAIFEGFILAELRKHFFNLGKTAPLYFWRDHLGVEVDVILEQAGKITALEIKSSQTYSASLTEGLKKFAKIAQMEWADTKLIYAGENNFSDQNLAILPWQKMAELLFGVKQLGNGD
jgi:predicted AAA+ superfamily ATPase